MSFLKRVASTRVFKMLAICLCFASFMLSGLGMGDGDMVKLINGRWELRSFGAIGEETSLIPDTRITLEFHKDNKISGFSGCNRYSGTYDVTADRTLSIKNLDTTFVLCLEPDGVMDQEKRYGNALSNVSDFGIEQNRLQLFDHDREHILNFVDISDVGVVEPKRKLATT